MFALRNSAAAWAIPMVGPSSDSRTPFRRPSIAGRMPIFGQPPTYRPVERAGRITVGLLRRTRPSLGDGAVEVPEILPTLAVLPQEELALDEAAVAVDAFDGLHLLFGERLRDRGAQVAQVLVTIDRERNRDLVTLHRPLYADRRRMYSQPLRDRLDDRILHVHRVAFGAVAVGTGGRADGSEPDRHYPALDHELEQLRLLEARVLLHLVAGGLDPGVPKEQLELGNRCVGGAD